MKIDFYVLQDKQNTDSNDALLNFVCRLTQTVLAKSSHSLLIVNTDNDQLIALDELLWTFADISFIPHERVTSDNIASSIAPVILTDFMPNNFDGVVLNLAPEPLKFADTNNALRPERVLEIIASDEVSKQQGREKYKYYQRLGITLKYHQV